MENAEQFDFILYLRPFQVDVDLNRFQPRQPRIVSTTISFLLAEDREEDQIVDALENYGEIIAVENPAVGSSSRRTRLIEPTTLSSENWKIEVRRLMRRARSLVIVYGTSDGLIWELGEAMRILDPSKVTILVPVGPHEYVTSLPVARKKLLRHARDNPKDDGSTWEPFALPDTIADKKVPSRVKGVIVFDSQGSCAFVPLRKYGTLYNSLKMMLVVTLRPLSINSEQELGSGALTADLPERNWSVVAAILLFCVGALGNAAAWAVTGDSISLWIKTLIAVSFAYQVFAAWRAYWFLALVLLGNVAIALLHPEMAIYHPWRIGVGQVAIDIGNLALGPTIAMLLLLPPTRRYFTAVSMARTGRPYLIDRS